MTRMFFLQHEMIQLVSLRPIGHQVTSFLHLLMTDLSLNETFVHKKGQKFDFGTTFSKFCKIFIKSSGWGSMHPDPDVICSEYSCILHLKPVLFDFSTNPDNDNVLILFLTLVTISEICSFYRFSKSYWFQSSGISSWTSQSFMSQLFSYYCNGCPPSLYTIPNVK